LTNQGQVLPQTQSQVPQQNQANKDQPVDSQVQGQVKTTTSTYTFTQQPQISSQYSYQPPGTQYSRQPVPATSYQATETGFTTGVGGRSNIELTL
jgi:O-acetylhomoserine/O-acetylserine sulfhydrylase-like pyridoxal-dependent enzyme